MQYTNEKRVEMALDILKKIDEIAEILKEAEFPEELNVFMSGGYLSINNGYKAFPDRYKDKFLDVVRTDDRIEVKIDGDGLFKRMQRM